MTEEQILVALLSLLLALAGVGVRISGYTSRRVGLLLLTVSALSLAGVLMWWAFDRFGWPAARYAGAVLGGIGMLVLLVLLSKRAKAHRRKSIILTPEVGPGRALVRVENVGSRADLTASARMISVEEDAPNEPYLQTYPLRWLATGRPTTTLESGSADALLIATSRKEPGPHYELPLFEVRLEGYQEGEAVAVDWRRWNGGEPDGSVTILLEVVVGSSAAAATKGRFLVKSRKWGGLLIQSAGTTHS